MATTFQNLIDRAEELATNIAGDAQTSPLIDSEVTAEVIYPHAVRSVFRDYAKTGRHLDDMQMDHAITMPLTGVAALPATVIRETLDHAYLPNDQFASKVPYEDYQRYRYDSQMCYFAIRGDNIYYSCADQLFADGRWVFGSNPAEGETIAVNGVTFTFRLPGVVVASAGDTAVNAEWTYRGNSLNDKFIYNKVGEPDTTIADEPYSLYWRNVTFGWAMLSESGDEEYYSLTGATPDLAVTWLATLGSLPVPTVTNRIGVVEVEIGTTKEITATNFAAALNASANASIPVATYTVADNVVTGVYDTAGSAGNAFTMADSSASAVTASGGTFASGTLVLNTPGIPTAPTAGSDVLTFSPAIIDDIVMKIASVLRGELKLNALIGNNDVRK